MTNDEVTFPKRIGYVGSGIGVYFPKDAIQMADLKRGDMVSVTVRKVGTRVTGKESE